MGEESLIGTALAWGVAVSAVVGPRLALARSRHACLRDLVRPHPADVGAGRPHESSSLGRSARRGTLSGHRPR